MLKTIQYSDKAQVLKVILTAFAEDKHLRWMLNPEQVGYQKRYAALIEYFFEDCWVNGEIYLTDDRNAAAMWRDQSKNAYSLGIFCSYLKAFWRLGIARALRLMRMEKELHAGFPTHKNYIYLWMIGVLPEAQGKGLSTQLLNPRLQQHNANSLPVYLETSSMDNVAIYRGKGFEVYDTWQPRDKSLELWLMKREPR